MLLSLLLSLAAPAQATPLRVGTYSYPRYDRRIALGPIAALAGRIAGRPAEIVLLPTPTALAEALCRGEVDVAMTNLGAFVEVRDCPNLRAIAVLDMPPPVLDRYRGVLLVRRETGIDTLDTLGKRASGLRYSEVLPGSTSGGLVQAEALRSAGSAPSAFAARRMAGTHEAALADLIEGRADVAALTEDPWRRLQASDPAKAATLHPIWRSAPLPPGPVVCHEGPATPCAEIQAALLGAQGGPTAVALAAGWSEADGATRFMAYDRARYEAFRTR